MKKMLSVVLVVASFGMGYAFCKITATPKVPMHGRVTGLGGIFFKCKDPKKLKEWYAKNLGLNTNQYGTIFEWRQARDSTKKGVTQWSPFSEKTKYFAPSTKDFMINYRVENIEPLVAQLRKDGVEITDSMDVEPYGKFIHIMDPEGNKVELWEPGNEFSGSDSGVTK